jgi:uncharacterized membrane protein
MALAELRGHWKTAILAYVLYSVMFSLPTVLLRIIFVGDNADAPISLIAAGGDGGISLFGDDFGAFAEQRARSSVSFLYSLLISGPLSLGIAGFALATARGATPGPGAVLGGFNNVFKAAGTYLLIALRIFLWCLAFILAAALLFAATVSMFLTAPSISAVFPIILVIVLMVVLTRLMLTYSQAFFLLADDPSLRVGDVLKQSRDIMVGNKKKLLFLYLSFIGWYIPWSAILCLSLYVPRFIDLPFLVGQFALPILSGILTAPLYAYMMVSGAVFYDIITGRRRS